MNQKRRVVVIGRNSAVWKRLAPILIARGLDTLAIGHSEVKDTAFFETDAVWIFSYSRNAAENRDLFSALATHRVRQFIYVSSATANIAPTITCYSYPTAKFLAEGSAREILVANVVRIGLVYAETDELPSGKNAATSLDDIASAMAFPVYAFAATQPTNLYNLVDTAFKSPYEKAAFKFYTVLHRVLRFQPCLTRPFDALFSLCGWKWYGYLYLSNQKCNSTIS